VLRTIAQKLPTVAVLSTGGTIANKPITAIGVFAADSSVATWKFNAAKSKTTSANPIKSQTDVRETTPDGGISVTRTGQFKDGTPNEGTYSYKYDGKESSVAATGLPFDKISVKRKDASTTSWEVKRRAGDIIKRVKTSFPRTAKC